MKNPVLLLVMLAGCGRLVGGRCDEAWSPRGIACDAGTSRDVTATIDRASTDDVPTRDATADLGADAPADDVPPLSDFRLSLIPILRRPPKERCQYSGLAHT